MSPDTWLSLAIQIPVVALFAIIVLKIQDVFLKHIEKQEAGSRQFIKEQREANNVSVRELSKDNKEALKALTDEMTTQLRCVSDRLEDIEVQGASHDSYMRSVFRERFGPPVIAEAERSAREAAQARAQELSKGAG